MTGAPTERGSTASADWSDLTSRVESNSPAPPWGAHIVNHSFDIDPGLAPWADSSGLFGPQTFLTGKSVPCDDTLVSHGLAFGEDALFPEEAVKI